MSKIDEVKELVEKGKAKLIGKAVEEALEEGCDPADILNQGIQPFRLDINNIQKFPGIFLISDCSLLQRLHKAPDGGKRSLQFMGNIRHKIRPHIFQLFYLSNIFNNEKHTP